MSEEKSEEKSYQEQYQEAWDKMDAADEGKQPEPTTAKPEASAAVEQPRDEQGRFTAAEAEKPAAVDNAQQQMAAMKAELEKAQKALQDTQRWGHQKAEEAARLRREHEQAQRAAKKPELLQSIPELEGAVDHVLAERIAHSQQMAEQAAQQEQERFEQNMSIVMQAHPDVTDLLKDQEFLSAMENRRKTIGEEKFDSNPALIIREVTAEKLDRAKRVFDAERATAIEAARKDAEKQAKAKASMTMPGAAPGGRVPASKDLTPEEINNMSTEDFRRMQARVTGF